MRSPHPAPSTERCLNPVKGRSAKPQHCARTQLGVRVPLSPPNLLKSNYRAILRGLFQYGLLHFGQTLGSPAVPFRGTQEWEQRLHL
jgi:hypothetical protein